jgi:hypothetical protein
MAIAKRWSFSNAIVAMEQRKKSILGKDFLSAKTFLG